MNLSALLILPSDSCSCSEAGAGDNESDSGQAGNVSGNVGEH